MITPDGVTVPVYPLSVMCPLSNADASWLRKQGAIVMRVWPPGDYVAPANIQPDSYFYAVSRRA